MKTPITARRTKNRERLRKPECRNMLFIVRFHDNHRGLGNCRPNWVTMYFVANRDEIMRTCYLEHFNLGPTRQVRKGAEALPIEKIGPRELRIPDRRALATYHTECPVNLPHRFT